LGLRLFDEGFGLLTEVIVIGGGSSKAKGKLRDEICV
jgi:hypothetical protein